MSLKGDRNEIVTDISFFMNETATRGGIVCLSTAGSGSALDQSSALVTYAAAVSGQVPIGMLMNDMVNVDQSKYRINVHKDEVQQGGKVCVMQKGFAVTDMITGTPTAGQMGYLGPSGYITPTSQVVDSTGYNQKIGRFLSTKDEDGYAKFFVDLPRL
jgi:hypothetical protein